MKTNKQVAFVNNTISLKITAYYNICEKNDEKLIEYNHFSTFLMCLPSTYKHFFNLR